MVGFENYLAQMITKIKQYVLCKNRVTTSKVKFTITLTVCEKASVKRVRVRLITLLSRLPQAWCVKGIQFPSVLPSHPGAILLKALGGGNSSTRQLIDTVFGDNSSTQLKTTHRHFLKTIHRHIIILQLSPN